MSRRPAITLGSRPGSGNIVELPHESRMYHTYVVGGSGSGKSKFLEYLIRQDIVNCPTTGSGMVVIDPHGSLYDNIVRWLAAANDSIRPIVPIDLRRTDCTVGYDLLRQRPGFEPSVVVNQLVDSIAYSWGAAGTDATPQFARWMNLILSTLYYLKRPFADAYALVTDDNFRRTCIRSISDPMLKSMWKTTDHLKPEAFLEQVNSSLNRLPRFFQNENLRRMFSQRPSFDFAHAMDEGHIVLICLGEDHGQISKQDGSTLGTLMLADLWTAAKERGKPGDASQIKPFYVYLDEFQLCLTPTIAENLEQARGYGLWMTLAHQGPYQLTRTGPQGVGLFSSVLTNCGNKVVFKTTNPTDLQPLVETLYLGAIDVDKVKHTIESTKVVRYDREDLTNVTRTTSTHSARREASGHKEVPLDHKDPEGEHRIISFNREEDEATTETDLVAESTHETLIPVLGTELSSIGYETVEEQFWRAKQFLASQEPRHAMAKLYGTRLPIPLISSPVSEPKASFYTAELYTSKLQSAWPFIVPRDRTPHPPQMDEPTMVSQITIPPTTLKPADDDDQDAKIWRLIS